MLILNRVARSVLVVIGVFALVRGAVIAAIQPPPVPVEGTSGFSKEELVVQSVAGRLAPPWIDSAEVHARTADAWLGQALYDRKRGILYKSPEWDGEARAAGCRRIARSHFVYAWEASPTSPRVAVALFDLAIREDNAAATRAVLTCARNRLPRYATFEFAIARGWLLVYASDRKADALREHRIAFDRAMAFGAPSRGDYTGAVGAAIACLDRARTVDAIAEAAFVVRAVLSREPGATAWTLKQLDGLGALGSWEDARAFLPSSPEAAAAWEAFAATHRK
jgi:hypothetical protein